MEVKELTEAQKARRAFLKLFDIPHAVFDDEENLTREWWEHGELESVDRFGALAMTLSNWLKPAAFSGYRRPKDKIVPIDDLI